MWFGNLEGKFPLYRNDRKKERIFTLWRLLRADGQDRHKGALGSLRGNVGPASNTPLQVTVRRRFFHSITEMH
jgi:hypothetical protein